MVKETYIGLKEELKRRKELLDVNESRIESQKKYNKQRYEILRSYNLCITCGKKLEHKGYSRCNACRKKCIEYAKKSYINNKAVATK